MQLTDLPKKINWPDEGEPPNFIEIRGEIYLSDSNFELLNNEKSIRGEKSSDMYYSSARNAASGLLRSKNKDVHMLNKLSFFAYQLSVSSPGAGVENSYTSFDQNVNLDLLRKLGFSVADFTRENTISFENIYKLIENKIENLKVNSHLSKKKLNELQIEIKNQISVEKHALASKIFQFCESSDLKSALRYTIDGVVIKVNDRNLQHQLGVGNRSPKWAIAYKFSAVEAVTKLIDIKIQVIATHTYIHTHIYSY
jgi:DNA ligase (NAD+)